MLVELVAFLAVSAAVICTPGQDTALTIRNALAGGPRDGVATAGGVALGQAVWTFAASAGLVAVLTASEPLFRALKLAGAAYLIFLGAESLYSALARRTRERGLLRRTGPKQRPSRALRQGLVSKLGNPKMAIFFASLLPQFAPGGPGSFAGLLALGLLFSSLTFAWLTFYAIAVGRLRRLLADPAQRVVDAVTGAVLVLFGVRLAAEQR